MPTSTNERRVRVLHVEANEDGTVGGSHRALVDLVSRVRGDRFEPVVLFYQDNVHVNQLREQGIEVHLFDVVRKRELELRYSRGLGKRLDFFGAILRRRRFLREHAIDLVHLNNSPRVGYDDWLPAAKLTGVPCVTFAMGDAINLSYQVRFSARRFDHVIAISEYMAEAMRGIGIARERLSTVALGVDANELRAAVRRSRDAVRKELGVQQSEVLVLMVGNIREWKGQRVVIEALRQLEAADLARIQVRFVGAESSADSGYRRLLDQDILAHGLRERVDFLGGRDDVPTLLAASDIAVHASTIPEPFGLVVPEAMVHGLPVIASKFGGPGEVLTPQCGRTFDPSKPVELARSLAELVNDPALRASMGSEARRRVALYSADAMVRGVEAAYERVLEGRGSR